VAPKVKSDEPFPDRRQRHEDEIRALRDTMSTVVRFVFAILATLLALGALFVVFGKNVSQDNGLVKFVLHVADAIDGPFGRKNGIFDFHGKNGPKLDAVVNWGIAAIVYLVIGSTLQRLLAPKTRR
jgi:hypothetical protein